MGVLAGARAKVKHRGSELRDYRTSLSGASDERHTSVSPGVIPHFTCARHMALKKSLEVKVQCSLTKLC